MLSIRSAWPLGGTLLLGSMVVLACSSSGGGSGGSGLSSGDSGDTCTPMVATEATTSSGAASCSSAGEATPGATDAHCSSADGGLTVQATRPASCCQGGDAGGPDTCPYGATMYGHEGDDDDCKYHVAWTSTPICEGAAGMQVTVKATYLGTGKPVTGANIQPEVFTTTPASEGTCDDKSSHESPSTFTVFSETTEGTYVGRVVFDARGAWTMRFHLFENCFDVQDDSPHGHAAFHVTVP